MIPRLGKPRDGVVHPDEVQDLIEYVGWSLGIVRDYAGEDAPAEVEAPEDLLVKAKCAAGELMMRLVTDGLIGPGDYHSESFEM